MKLLRAYALLFLLLVSAVQRVSVANVDGTTTCPPISPPEHGSVTRCTTARNHLSVCTITCVEGYDIQGGSRLLCWCGPSSCFWRGKEPFCKGGGCDTPGHDNGRIRFIDKWPKGFGGVIEIVDIPDVRTKFTSGWSIVIVFDQPLGRNSTLSCWNADVVSTSHDHQTFTLANAAHNANLWEYLDEPSLRWTFIVDGVDSAMPEAAYIGLFHQRIKDTSCLKTRKMHHISFIRIADDDNSDKVATAANKLSTTATTRSSDERTAHSTSVLPTTSWRTTTLLTEPTETTTPPPITTATTSSTTTTMPITTTTTTTTSEQTQTTTTKPTEPITIQKQSNKPKKRKHRRKRKRTTTPFPTTATTSTKVVTIPGGTTDDTENSSGMAEQGPDSVVLEKSSGRHCIFQSSNGSYKTQEGWEDEGIPYFSGNAILTVEDHLLDWSMLIIFDSPLEEIQVWSCTVVDKSDDGRMWTFGPHSWNLELYPGESDINFIAKQSTKTPNTPVGKVYLCSYAFAEGDAIVISPDSQPQIPLQNVELPQETVDDEIDDTTVEEEHEDVDISTEDFQKWKKPVTIERRCMPNSPTGIPPKRQTQTAVKSKPNNDGTKYNYNEVLHTSILFYEAQRAGRLPRKNRIPWRGDSTLKDGCDIGVDLSGGWFDAGDHVKFHFPMASSVTMLAWGGLLFQDAYKDAGELRSLLDSVKWPVDYLIKSHISKFELVGQVGSGKIDHGTCGRPEEMKMPRKTYIIDPQNPGTELAAEVSAALAASHLLFKATHPKFARSCLEHAIELFEFADQFRGEYHNAIPEVKDYYFSYSGYDDELIWAAAWLYKATEDEKYLAKAREWYVKLGGEYAVESEFSWDRKLVGAQILLANFTGDEIYRKPVKFFLDNLLTARATPKGLFWVRRWGPNRYAANVAYMALAASTLSPQFPKMETYVEWARKQIHLLLGDIGRSYVVGLGKNPPKNVHHRSSACKPFPALCNCQTFHSPTPNFFTVYGALVGGPNEKEIYSNNRMVYEQTEVACDHNAGFQGAVAGLKHIAMKKRKSAKTSLQNNMRKWFV